jgi:hypothetical protein
MTTYLLECPQNKRCPRHQELILILIVRTIVEKETPCIVGTVLYKHGVSNTYCAVVWSPFIAQKSAV